MLSDAGDGRGMNRIPGGPRASSIEAVGGGIRGEIAEKSKPLFPSPSSAREGCVCEGRRGGGGRGSGGVGDGRRVGFYPGSF